MSIRIFLLSLGLLVATLPAARAQNATATTTADESASLAGKWTGTYEGSDSGSFELVINQDSNKKLAGQIIMLAPDGSRYSIDLKTITWQNGQLKASYADPQGGNDPSFQGTMTGSVLKGTWVANGGQDSGNWQASRADR
ncbi:hypothetical protein [Spirosoma rigui]|uniref:hypothetical protein n=1 Tax=Spirosoma rigui TaxID=564064 RepID=UPI001FE45198|nr:hypothetical protein [Spirosoma rigui]